MDEAFLVSALDRELSLKLLMTLLGDDDMPPLPRVATDKVVVREEVKGVGVSTEPNTFVEDIVPLAVGLFESALVWEEGPKGSLVEGRGVARVLKVREAFKPVEILSVEAINGVGVMESEGV